jgi:hypothetical protein
VANDTPKKPLPPAMTIGLEFEAGLIECAVVLGEKNCL